MGKWIDSCERLPPLGLEVLIFGSWQLISKRQHAIAKRHEGVCADGFFSYYRTTEGRRIDLRCVAYWKELDEPCNKGPEKD